MKRIYLLLILFTVAGTLSADEITSVAEPVVAEAPDSVMETLSPMELQMETITDPAEKLFFKAGIEQGKGDLERAIQTLSLMVVQHANNKKWIARGDLKIAELYLELGMLKQADATARQVQAFYEGTEPAEKAKRLSEKIKQLMEQSEKSE